MNGEYIKYVHEFYKVARACYHMADAMIRDCGE